jgi:hypothetical protein
MVDLPADGKPVNQTQKPFPKERPGAGPSDGDASIIRTTVAAPVPLVAAAFEFTPLFIPIHPPCHLVPPLKTSHGSKMRLSFAQGS